MPGAPTASARRQRLIRDCSGCQSAPATHCIVPSEDRRTQGSTHSLLCHGPLSTYAQGHLLQEAFQRCHVPGSLAPLPLQDPLAALPSPLGGCGQSRKVSRQTIISHISHRPGTGQYHLSFRVHSVFPTHMGSHPLCPLMLPRPIVAQQVPRGHLGMPLSLAVQDPASPTASSPTSLPGSVSYTDPCFPNVPAPWGQSPKGHQGVSPL